MRLEVMMNVECPSLKAMRTFSELPSRATLLWMSRSHADSSTLE